MDSEKSPERLQEVSPERLSSHPLKKGALDGSTVQLQFCHRADEKVKSYQSGSVDSYDRDAGLTEKTWQVREAAKDFARAWRLVGYLCEVQGLESKFKGWPDVHSLTPKTH